MLTLLNGQLPCPARETWFVLNGSLALEYIFDRTLPMTTIGSINQVWKVCALLKTFQGPSCWPLVQKQLLQHVILCFCFAIFIYYDLFLFITTYPLLWFRSNVLSLLLWQMSPFPLSECVCVYQWCACTEMETDWAAEWSFQDDCSVRIGPRKGNSFLKPQLMALLPPFSSPPPLWNKQHVYLRLLKVNLWV